MKTKTNGQTQTKSLKKIRHQPLDYSFKSSTIISPFVRQLRIFEQRVHHSHRNARDRFKEQSREFKMRSASILKETKQMINEGSSVHFCDIELIKRMEQNDNDREKEMDLVERMRKFRAKQKGLGSSRWLETANTSVRTEKLKALESRGRLFKDKQNIMPQALKTFLNYKKNPLKIKAII